MFLNNFRNLPNFTAIQLHGSYMGFAGLNGEVCMTPITSQTKKSCLSLKHLAQLDTSKTEWLEIQCSEFPPSGHLHRMLLPMKTLRTITLYQCKPLHSFIIALDPTMSPSGAVVCPKLEELVIEHKGVVDIKDVIGMAAARASGGAKLRSLRVVSCCGTVSRRLNVLELELEKHVLDVEYRREVDGAGNDGGDSDEGD